MVPRSAGPTVRNGTIGALASDIFTRRRDTAGSIRRLVRDPNMRLLGRLLYGDGSRRGDLLSYLFFDPEFMNATIELGRLDASAAFSGAPTGRVPWQIGP